MINPKVAMAKMKIRVCAVRMAQISIFHVMKSMADIKAEKKYQSIITWLFFR